jgi:hypothetical protein
MKCLKIQRKGEENLKQKFTSEKILSLSAIVIALASIAIAIWEGVEIRKHNRLSVRPKLEIFFSPSSDNNEISWILINNGIGPGIIQFSRLVVDGKAYAINNGSVYNEIIDILKVEDVSISKMSSLNSGLSIIAGASRNMIGFKLKSDTSINSTFWEIHDRIKFEIGYESMYGESFLCTYPMDSN